MAEEHRCEVPEGHRLCANNCGFLGSPATMNLCSKCYGDFRLKEQQEASSIKSSSSTVFESVSVTVKESSLVSAVAIAPVAEQRSQEQQQQLQHQPNRCTVCRKRVGLTGFKCKCGITFCGSHRYPENHGCTFDFKKVGRDEIARANPLVKAEKLVRI